MEWLGDELATSRSQVRRSNYYTTEQPPTTNRVQSGRRFECSGLTHGGYLLSINAYNGRLDKSRHTKVGLYSGYTRFWLRHIQNPTIFGNPVKSGQNWRMLVQLQCIQLITDKSSGVFPILITVTQTIKISLPFHKFCQKLANGEVTRQAQNCTASL